MALPLHIPKCIQSPAHCFHPPPLDRPVRIHIEGPLVSIQKLLPEVSWHVDVHEKKFQQAGAKLAELTYRTIYGHDVRLHVENDLIMRDEYLGWSLKILRAPTSEIDYYGVTFDHLVDEDGGEYANTYLPFTVDPAEYMGKKILAVPRCCQRRKGTIDRSRVNGSVTQKDIIRQGIDPAVIRRLLIAYGVYSTKIPDKKFDKVPQPRTCIAPEEQ
ncbi:hypothetical protein X797_008078 [Metarhizium robertsii]|uniref:Uncharacterized protein n=1 Tax=Metarhizium robertsii TaxID=568076 RepID=A0A014NBY0_9HYPO|nr:hypothetical protein X797_008078 [Metarhizium robertsii]